MKYSGGIDFLCKALASHVDVQTNCRATNVEESSDHVTVTWQQNGKEKTETVSASVITVTGHQVPDLYPQLNAHQKEILLDFDYATVFNGHLGLSSIPDEPSMIVQIPKSEDAGLCVLALPHNCSPDLAPAGKGLCSSYWLHSWCEDRKDLADDEILDEMMPSFKKVVPEIANLIEMRHLDRWRPGVLMSKPGSYKAMAEFVNLIDHDQRVQLAGDYFCISSTNASAISGEKAAETLARKFGCLDTTGDNAPEA